ncbi:MAG: hypothetical protein ACRENE_12205, partial [Polyangiaceae bacterium]
MGLIRVCALAFGAAVGACAALSGLDSYRSGDRDASLPPAIEGGADDASLLDDQGVASSSGGPTSSGATGSSSGSSGGGASASGSSGGDSNHDSGSSSGSSSGKSSSSGTGSSSGAAIACGPSNCSTCCAGDAGCVMANANAGCGTGGNTCTD